MLPKPIIIFGVIIMVFSIPQISLLNDSTFGLNLTKEHERIWTKYKNDFSKSYKNINEVRERKHLKKNFCFLIKT